MAQEITAVAIVVSQRSRVTRRKEQHEDHRNRDLKPEKDDSYQQAGDQQQTDLQPARHVIGFCLRGLRDRGRQCLAPPGLVILVPR